MLKFFLVLLTALAITAVLIYVLAVWQGPTISQPKSTNPTYLTQEECQAKTGYACGQNPRLEWTPSAIKLVK